MGSGNTVVNILKYTALSTLLFAVFFAPFHASASVFSFISNIFKSSTADASEVSPNSQTIALLQAPLSPNSKQATSTKDSVKIIEGTSLLSDAKPSPESDTVSPSKDQISIYVVRTGDTLPAIAKMFGVTKNTIVWANDIQNNTIKVGQTLVILPISGVEHVVKSGDTVSSIAKLHKGDVAEIMQYNDLSLNAKLAIGDIVIVPDGEITTTSSGGAKSSSGSGKSTGGTSSTDGYFTRPIIGGTKTQGIHGHNGVDLSSSFGSSILAAAEGTVLISKSSGWNGGYGSYIVLSHGNGTQTLYGHLSGTTVNVGDHVNKGQLIGYMGSTGNSTGTHLHFEVRGGKNPF